MDLTLFSSLYDRIQLEPSILLLGQNYLSMGGERDPVWETLCAGAYAGLDLPRRRANYPLLWQQAVKTAADAGMAIRQIADAGQGVWKNQAAAAVLKLRWSLLYTSAIDDTEVMVTDKGCTFVPQEEKNAKPQYLNKDRRYRVNLCGSRDFPPPALQDKGSGMLFRRQIANKISWISNTYLEYYGVLVIDGLDPECDWLDDKNLFGQLLELPPNSVFWFSAPERLEENASFLKEQGILTTDPDGFYEHLLRHMPELLDAGDAPLASEEEDGVLFTPLTLRLGNDKQTRTVRIRRSDITDITGDNLCVIDDEILLMNPPGGKSRANQFADFLMQRGLPSWQLFNIKSNETPFYIQRDKDSVLERDVYHALKQSGVARKPVVLCGPSNSGKSMMLANLAMTIARRRKYPVIFIRGEMVSGAEARLERFIDNWFCDTERYGGDRPDKIIVIWDASGLKRTGREYENLQKLLFNRNVQVVGSAYAATGTNAVNLEQNLSSNEEQQLCRILSSLGESYMERFHEIARCRSEVKTLRNTSLLYLLQALFKYEFDAEYRSLAAILARQFNQEREYAEQRASQNLHEYVESFFKAQELRAQHGVASSFQEKMQLLLAQMAVADRAADAAGQTGADEKAQKLEKYRELSERIAEINRVLAVASEFGIKLPLRLLLRFLRDRGGASYVAYGEEASKIIGILRSDTLLDFNYRNHPYFGEEYYIGFRNSIEAENYICLLCDLPLEDHSEKRRRKEVEILHQIILAAETEAERWSVIELARQFGPNGHGMLSELENTRKGADYLEYRPYWMEIAGAMIGQFPDDPEATLLYAHLTREYIAQEEREGHASFEAQYNEARTRLETALRRMENSQHQIQQYDRLSVELCANYQQMLRSQYDSVIYDSIKKRIRAAFHRSKGRSGAEVQKDFSSNNMLDILLNAYGEYKKSSPQAQSSAAGEELTEIVCDIDDMLDLDDLIYEKKSQELIKKIKGVYEELGSGCAQMEQLEQKLIDRNSDAFLYLRARMIWQEDAPALSKEGSDPDAALLFEDRYMAICRDFPFAKVGIPPQLKQQVRSDAQRVIAFLAANEDTIRKTKSERCVAMLLRARWFLKTGTPMLEEKQQAPLTRGEWEEIKSLCDRYLSYHEGSPHEPFIPAYFLKGAYEWIYGDAERAFDLFQTAKDKFRYDSQARSIERLVLCVEGTSIPRTFLVSVERSKSDNRKYSASIIKETTRAAVGADAVRSRYGLGASEPVVKYLFDGTMPKEQRQQAKKEGVIRFNLIGPQIGIAQTGGDER